MNRILSALLLVFLLSGCAKLAVQTVKTAGDICCTTISTTGKVAAATVKATGHVVNSGVENPDGMAAAAAMVP